MYFVTRCRYVECTSQRSDGRIHILSKKYIQVHSGIRACRPPTNKFLLPGKTRLFFSSGKRARGWFGTTYANVFTCSCNIVVFEYANVWTDNAEIRNACARRVRRCVTVIVRTVTSMLPNVRNVCGFNAYTVSTFPRVRYLRRVRPTSPR
jgi:hypothetical protein